MVVDFEIQMIEQIERIVLAIANVARFLRLSTFRHVATDRKAARAEFLLLGIGVAQSHRHIIDDPVLLVIQDHAFHQTLE